MSDKKGDLPGEMIKRATLDGLPDDHELFSLAFKLEAAINGFFAEPQTHSVAQFVGSWARARKAWCNYTGEALI